MVALLGPSGSENHAAASYCRADLTAPENCISSGEEEVSGWRQAGEPGGFVFQHYALFRHMTVFDNLLHSG